MYPSLFRPIPTHSMRNKTDATLSETHTCMFESFAPTQANLTGPLYVQRGPRSLANCQNERAAPGNSTSPENTTIWKLPLPINVQNQHTISIHNKKKRTLTEATTMSANNAGDNNGAPNQGNRGRDGNNGPQQQQAGPADGNPPAAAAQQQPPAAAAAAAAVPPAPAVNRALVANLFGPGVVAVAANPNNHQLAAPVVPNENPYTVAAPLTMTTLVINVSQARRNWGQVTTPHPAEAIQGYSINDLRDGFITNEPNNEYARGLLAILTSRCRTEYNRTIKDDNSPLVLPTYGAILDEVIRDEHHRLISIHAGHFNQIQAELGRRPCTNYRRYMKGFSNGDHNAFFDPG